MFIVVCNAEPSAERTDAQENKAAHGPQPPQGGAGLHGAIAAAAQCGGEPAGSGEMQRGKREAKYIWQLWGLTGDPG